MELVDWIRDKTGALSIDADFFMCEAERRLAPLVARRVEQKLAAGAPIAFRDDHVELVELLPERVDFVVNLDYHMDCRLEFLHGDASRTPPCNASLFETLLASGLTKRYVWAFPAARRRHAALAYASGVVAGRQPLIRRLHCVSARSALDGLLRDATIEMIFVCRSPEYATAQTDAIHAGLRSIVADARVGEPAPP